MTRRRPGRHVGRARRLPTRPLGTRIYDGADDPRGPSTCRLRVERGAATRARGSSGRARRRGCARAAGGSSHRHPAPHVPRPADGLCGAQRHLLRCRADALRPRDRAVVARRLRSGVDRAGPRDPPRSRPHPRTPARDHRRASRDRRPGVDLRRGAARQRQPACAGRCLGRGADRVRHPVVRVARCDRAPGRPDLRRPHGDLRRVAARPRGARVRRGAAVGSGHGRARSAHRGDGCRSIRFRGRAGRPGRA